MKKFPCLFLVIMLMSAAIFACAPVTLETTSPPDLPGTGKILVLPFKDMAKIYGVGVNIRTPVTGKIMTTGKVAERADSFLTDHLFSLMKNKKKYHLIPPGQAQGVISGLLLSENRMKSKELELLVDTAKKLGAQTLFTGHVYRYEERVGNTFSVEQPASVAFDLHLIAVNSGRIIWSAVFDETQKSLSENLFRFPEFMAREGKWIRADQLALSGLKQMLEGF